MSSSRQILHFSPKIVIRLSALGEFAFARCKLIHLAIADTYSLLFHPNCILLSVTPGQVYDGRCNYLFALHKPK